jgi:hypothetical protein
VNINTIVSNPKYINVCKKITPSLWQDLWQESVLEILKIDKNKLHDAYINDYLDFYIIKIITGVWRNRGRVKSYKSGTTSPLYYFTNYNKDEFNDPIYYEINKDCNTQVKFLENIYHDEIDTFYIKAKQIIINDCNSEDMDVRYRARVFNYSNGNPAELEINGYAICKNAREFSISSGIKYSALIKTCNEYKESLKNKLYKIVYE